MKPTEPIRSDLENKTFLALVITVTLAFGWILWPFYGAIFWGLVLAILFAPLFRRLLRKLRERRTLASLATLAVILVIVILPLVLITGLLLQEGAATYQKIQSGEINFGHYFERFVSVLPSWVTDVLDRFGLGNLKALQDKLSASVTQGSRFIATQAFSIGQNTFDFVVNFFIVLYLAFFFLRDGPSLSKRVRDAIPLNPEHKRLLFTKFTTVIRATVKGNILVAVAQGALGGIAFWFLDIHAPVLWAVIMAFLSLLPAVGAALIWFPVALYFLLSGGIWQGVTLMAYGVLVIGLVDNVLRPVLVGKDTKMPDYVVLMSTLGGMAIFGLNGFVIGPMVAAMFMAVWDIFVESRRATPSAETSSDKV
jgi:predicted PurR-regulated permease PerM